MMARVVPPGPVSGRVSVGRGEGPPTGVPPSAGGTLKLVGTVAVLVLVNLQPAARWWGWGRLVLGARPFRQVAGLGLAKVLGSGAGGGFGASPSGTHQGLFLVFEDEAAAQRFVAGSPLLAAYRAHSREMCVAVLRACSSKGTWSGAAMLPTATPPVDGPIAALTRASVRPQRAWSFWRLSPPAERGLAAAPGCLLAAGLGEAPLLRQATFSLWTDARAMDAYARSGAHQDAIRAAYTGSYFSESMFVRFVPLSITGSWQGRRHG